MLSVPEEIYLEILLRVPVKSTYVWKCVSKSWFQIITNPSFVKMHLNIATQRNNYNLMFESYDSRKEKWIIKSISYDSLSSINASESQIVELVDYPFSCSIWNFRFLGSCNGLVCLWSDIGVETIIYLCNPATKEYKGIPKSRHDYWNDYFINMINAFGYDYKAGDYKLINIVEYHGTDQLLDVYTLRSNSWESSRQTMTYKFPKKRQTGILVHGAFHWFGEARERNPPNTIISMNISNEKFDEVQLSKELLGRQDMPMTIGVLEGCLCLLVVVYGALFEVWMLQDYGVQESWTRRYITQHENCSRVSNIRYTGYTSGLVGSFQNGQILLKNGNSLVIYDPKHSTGREPKTFSSLQLQQTIIYVESLVSLYSGTCAGGNKWVRIYIPLSEKKITLLGAFHIEEENDIKWS